MPAFGIPIDKHHVRQVLRALHSDEALAASPLIRMTAVAQLQKEGKPAEAALRLVVQTALDQMARASRGSETERADRQVHATLVDLFVEGRTHHEIEARLNISKSEVYRRANIGTDRLVAILLDIERAAVQRPGAATTAFGHRRRYAPPRRNAAFMVGRERMIDDVRAWLTAGRGAVLALYGPAGIG